VRQQYGTSDVPPSDLPFGQVGIIIEPAGLGALDVWPSREPATTLAVADTTIVARTTKLLFS